MHAQSSTLTAFVQSARMPCGHAMHVLWPGRGWYSVTLQPVHVTVAEEGAISPEGEEGEREGTRDRDRQTGKQEGGYKQVQEECKRKWQQRVRKATVVASSACVGVPSCFQLVCLVCGRACVSELGRVCA